jgi:hypothetical protein
VRGDSSMWSERFFQPAADPTRQPQAVRAFHLAGPGTPDLLRHLYVFDGAPLEVVESINFSLVRSGAPLLPLAPASRASRVRALAARLLQLETPTHRWAFQLPAELADGARFCTDPDADPMSLVSWESRVDGGIRNGQLWFLAYKKFFDRADFRDIDRWFDEPFRAAHGRR